MTGGQAATVQSGAAAGALCISDDDCKPLIRALTIALLASRQFLRWALAWKACAATGIRCRIRVIVVTSSAVSAICAQRH
jgi:hypothetical protein